MLETNQIKSQQNDLEADPWISPNAQTFSYSILAKESRSNKVEPNSKYPTNFFLANSSNQTKYKGFV